MSLDPSIVHRLSQGSEIAFKEIYDLYSKKIYTVAIKYGLSQDEANSIVQDVFLKLWYRRNTLKQNHSLNAYLLTITKNILIDMRKKQAHEMAYKKYLEQQDLNSFMDTEQQFFYSEFEQLAETFIENLPPQQREIFVLSKRENLANKTIAKKLNLSLRTVENQVYRATKKIKEALRRNGLSLGLLISIFLLH